MSEDKNDEKPIGETLASGLSSIKRIAVRGLAHINYGFDYLKSSVASMSVLEGAERALSPVQNLKDNIGRSIFGASVSINENYPFLCSMAKSHQTNLMVQVGLGSGLITHIAFRNFVMRRFRLFAGVSSLMALNTYAAAEIVKFADQNRGKYTK